jgi:tetratricopeptide (TPR) repeat protein
MLKADYKFANYYLQEALKLDPDFELALLNLATLNLQLGEKDRAKALLKRIIQINSKNVSAINALRQLNFK